MKLENEWKRISVAALFGAALLLLPACGEMPPASKVASAGASVNGAVEDKSAPDFTLESVDGARVTLSESGGRVRLLDFWATWCAPCREEIPMLKKLQADYGDKGLEILAISEEDSDVIREFVEDHEINYTNLVGTVEVSEQYEDLGLPMAFLVDAEGRVVETFMGPKPRKILEQKIVKLLESGPST